MNTHRHSAKPNYYAVRLPVDQETGTVFIRRGPAKRGGFLMNMTRPLPQAIINARYYPPTKRRELITKYVFCKP